MSAIHVCRQKSVRKGYRGLKVSSREARLIVRSVEVYRAIAKRNYATQVDFDGEAISIGDLVWRDTSFNQIVALQVNNAIINTYQLPLILEVCDPRVEIFQILWEISVCPVCLVLRALVLVRETPKSTGIMPKPIR